MDFYNIIKNLDDEQIKELISFKVAELTYKSKVFPNRFIGIDCDINPKRDFYGEVESKSQSVWQGFIPKDVKIIYSFVPNEEGYTVNNGCYYYIDDDTYIYEFAKYIKDKEVKSEIDFLTHVYNFIENYFYGLTIHDYTREQMHHPLLRADGKYLESSSGHRFLDFKDANNAMCSEYSAMAQNILSVFGYTMIYFCGAVKTSVGTGGHVFNFGLVDSNPCIIDFTIPVKAYSLNNRRFYYSPFLGPVKDYNSETFKNHFFNQIPYDFNDYNYVETSNQFSMIADGNTRHYVIGNISYFKNAKTLHKKNK